MRWLLFALLGAVVFVVFRRRSRSPRASTHDRLADASAPDSVSWNVEPEEERHDGVHRERGDFVPYRSLLRTTDIARLTMLEAVLNREGIRNYRSQTSWLHGGEMQLFVERDRLEHAEALLERLDEPTPPDQDERG